MLASDQDKVEDYDWANKYRLKKSGWGSLYRVLHLKTGVYVAIKQYRTSQFSNDVKSQLINLASAAQIVKGDCIAKHLKTFIFPDFLYVVLELCDISLQQYLAKKKEPLRQQEIGEIISHIVKGMKSIRSNKCIHGNLNPFNILKKGKVWKLSHFTKQPTNAKSKNVYQQDTREGKYHYVAPQVLLFNQIPSLKSDVWSLGIIIHQLLYKTTPFNNQDINTFKKLLTTQITYPNQSEKTNQKLLKLMHLCLQKDPLKRISWQQIENHSYLVPYMKKDILIEEPQKKDIVDILSSLQASASLTLGSDEAVQQFCNGKLQWNGVTMTSNKLMKYEQFRKLCQNLSPTMDQIEIRMVYKWMDTSDDGYIDQKEFARILSSLRCIDIIKKFLDDLSAIIKEKNIDAQSLFSNYDQNQSACLQQSQIRQIAQTLIPEFPKRHLSLVIDHVNKKFNGRLPIRTIYQEYKSRNPLQSTQKNSKVKEELENFRSQLKQFELTIVQMVRNFDLNKNHKLDFQQFKKMVYSVDGFVRQNELRLMFNEVDKNGSGHVSVKELEDFYANS